MAKGPRDEVRQWYGDGVRATLLALVEAVRILPGREVEVGPTDPAAAASWGFWARGEGEALDDFERDLENAAAARGIRVQSIDVAVRA